MNSNKYTLDRFDEGFAVLLLKENEAVEKLVPEESLNETANEGDVIEVVFNEDGTINNFTILESETKEMKESVSSLIEKLRNK